MRIFALPLAAVPHGLQDGGRGLRCFFLQAAALETADSLSLFFIFFKKNKKKRKKALDTFFFLLYDYGIHGEETCHAAKKNGYAAPSATQPFLRLNKHSLKRFFFSRQFLRTEKRLAALFFAARRKKNLEEG